MADAARSETDRATRRGDRIPLLVALVTALVLRVSFQLANPPRLSDDRDAYLTLAESVATTGQYGWGPPTAFRPPLYPLLLVPAVWLGQFVPAATPLGVALLNLAATAATLLIVASVADRTFGSRRASFVAVSILATSPLAIVYSASPMTETLCGSLVAGLVWVSVRFRDCPGRANALMWGVIAGLAALCRPTMWVAAAFVWLSLLVGTREWRRLLLGGAAMLVVVSPWVVRNLVELGSPVVMTTHGGYTLALGNNADFDRDVVQVGWRVLWERGQQRWIAERQAAFERAGLTTELQQDAAHRSDAVEWITQNPTRFAAACWLRLRRFWSPIPLGEQSALMKAIVAVWSIGLFAVATVGAWRTRHRDKVALALLLSPVVAFTAVHLVYWANARMRLPIEPALALLAAGAVVRRRPSDATP